MPLSTEQQIYNCINKANKILICFKENFEIDSLASALALGYCLKKLDKQVTVACSNFELTSNLGFLPLTNEIKDDLLLFKNLVVSLDVSETQLKELSYHVKDNKLKIFITPKNGSFTSDQVKFENSNFKYDLIFVVDTLDLESLGKIYEKNTEFFYGIPIINIDHHTENEHFGQINYINLVSASTSEIIYKEIESFGKDIIDEDLATLLLAGIISKTKNFRSLQITPQTLIATSSLIMAGGRREEIVNNLYRTKSVADIKLWGRVLARLESDHEVPGLIWSTLKADDFKKSGCGNKNLEAVMDELMATIPGADMAVLFYENPENNINIKITSYNKNIDLSQLTQKFSAKNSNGIIELSVKHNDIVKVEKKVLDIIREGLKNIHG